MASKHTSTHLTRREFGGLVSAAAAVPLFGASQTTRSPQPDYVPPPRPLIPDAPPFEAQLAFTRKDIAPRVEPFPMTQVRLLPNGIFHDAQEWNRGYMSRLAADRLLYTFRANAGLPVGSVKPLGGWEQPENGRRSSELRGHFGGHFLSATALLYASTGDAEAKAKGDYMVAELARCQERLGGKYLSAFPMTWWERLEKGQRVWAPFYTIHKIMAGMFDMHRLAANTQALGVLERMAEWVDEWTASKTDAHMQAILEIEFGGIAETLYNLAAATNEDRWAKVGDRFQKKSFINPLALRRDELRGLHANTHIPQAIAAARRYEISSDVRFHDVASYFFDEVSDGAIVRDGRDEQRRRVARAAAASRRGVERQSEHGRMLLRLQHAQAHASPLRVAPRSAVLRLLRAPAAQSPHRHHTAECRDDPVLPLVDSRRVEDIQHGGPDVLVLYRYRHRGIREAHRQHLLARRCRRVRQSVHSVRAALGLSEAFACGRRRRIPNTREPRSSSPRRGERT